MLCEKLLHALWFVLFDSWFWTFTNLGQHLFFSMLKMPIFLKAFKSYQVLRESIATQHDWVCKTKVSELVQCHHLSIGQGRLSLDQPLVNLQRNQQCVSLAFVLVISIKMDKNMLRQKEMYATCRVGGTAALHLMWLDWHDGFILWAAVFGWLRVFVLAILFAEQSHKIGSLMCKKGWHSKA